MKPPSSLDETAEKVASKLISIATCVHNFEKFYLFWGLSEQLAAAVSFPRALNLFFRDRNWTQWSFKNAVY